MENLKVSVIMPVYNTEEYVVQAIQSIMNQTLTDIEIIIINDGSTDNSLKISEELAQKDNRIQLYTQKNQGQSIARNLGMQYASGKYLYFMDSDDLLQPETLELCYSKSEAYNLDFVFFDASILESEGQTNLGLKYNRKDATNEKEVYTGSEILKIMLTNQVYSASPCLSFIRKSYMASISLNFYPGIIHEDELFTFKLYLYANRVMAIHHAFFIRRVRQNSTMTQTFSWKNMHGYLIVAEEIHKLRKTTKSKQAKETTELFLIQMLNAAVWKAHTLALYDRLNLLKICILKFNKYIKIKTILTLLFKSYKK